MSKLPFGYKLKNSNPFRLISIMNRNFQSFRNAVGYQTEAMYTRGRMAHTWFYIGIPPVVIVGLLSWPLYYVTGRARFGLQIGLGIFGCMTVPVLCYLSYMHLYNRYSKGYAYYSYLTINDGPVRLFNAGDKCSHVELDIAPNRLAWVYAIIPLDLEKELVVTPSSRVVDYYQTTPISEQKLQDGNRRICQALACHYAFMQLYLGVFWYRGMTCTVFGWLGVICAMLFPVYIVVPTHFGLIAGLALGEILNFSHRRAKKWYNHSRIDCKYRHYLTPDSDSAKEAMSRSWISAF